MKEQPGWKYATFRERLFLETINADYTVTGRHPRIAARLCDLRESAAHAFRAGLLADLDPVTTRETLTEAVSEQVEDHLRWLDTTVPE